MEPESRWACPTCGERRLALEELPTIGAMGAQPYSDLVGMGDPMVRSLPEIVCLNCGRRWPDAGSYWAEAGGVREGPTGAADAVEADEDADGGG